MRLQNVLHALLAALAGAIAATIPAKAQNAPPVSQCQAIAETLPHVRFARFSPSIAQRAQSEENSVRITYVGHSTYLIETPAGVSIATDYDGFSGPVGVPTVVTMNKAHSGHNTPAPDPAIEHVLRGWNPEGGAADHDVVVEDAYIRNVTTDIRAGYQSMEADGNSIFIVEVAGLCIGHLGHLHHELTDAHYLEIGRLDIVMVPVDGGLTLGAQSMGAVVKRLRASLILPMHRVGAPISEFLELFGDDYARDISSERSMDVSLRTLPRRPTIVVLAGV